MKEDNRCIPLLLLKWENGKMGILLAEMSSLVIELIGMKKDAMNYVEII